MQKFKELTDQSSCINRAKNDEWTFVLLGRDSAAPDTIRDWVRRRIKMGKNKTTDRQIIEALSCAKKMEEEYAILRATL